MEPFESPYFESPNFGVYSSNNIVTEELYVVIAEQVAFLARISVSDNVRFVAAPVLNSIHNSVQIGMLQKSPLK
jgi:hypothetical protein